MPIHTIYATSASGAGWTTPSNAVGDTTGTFTFDGLPLEAPEMFSASKLRSADNTTYNVNAADPGVPSAKAFATFVSFASLLPIAVAKAQDIWFQVRIETNGADETAILTLVFSAAAHAAIPDTATFVSVEVEMSHDTSDVKVYRARINWSVPDDRGRRYAFGVLAPSPMVRQ